MMTPWRQAGGPGYRLAAVGWIAVTSFVLLVPGGGTVLSVPAWLPPWVPVDLVGHFGLFAGFGLLVHRATGRLGVSVLSGVGYAGLTEALQIPIPGRSGELADLVADGLGLLAGIGVSLVLQRRYDSARRLSSELPA